MNDDDDDCEMEGIVRAAKSIQTVCIMRKKKTRVPNIVFYFNSAETSARDECEKKKKKKTGEYFSVFAMNEMNKYRSYG